MAARQQSLSFLYDVIFRGKNGARIAPPAARPCAMPWRLVDCQVPRPATTCSSQAMAIEVTALPKAAMLALGDAAACLPVQKGCVLESHTPAPFGENVSSSRSSSHLSRSTNNVLQTCHRAQHNAWHCWRRDPERRRAGLLQPVHE